MTILTEPHYLQLFLFFIAPMVMGMWLTWYSAFRALGWPTKESLTNRSLDSVVSFVYLRIFCPTLTHSLADFISMLCIPTSLPSEHMLSVFLPSNTVEFSHFLAMVFHPTSRGAFLGAALLGIFAESNFTAARFKILEYRRYYVSRHDSLLRRLLCWPDCVDSAFGPFYFTGILAGTL